MYKMIKITFTVTLFMILMSVSAYSQDLNKKLIEAAKYAKVKEVKILFNGGADVDTKDNMGITPLMWTAHGMPFELLDSSGKVEYGGEKTEKDHEEIARFLIEKGADVDAKANDGMTALQAAAHRGHAGIVNLLLAHGAKLHAKDNSGITALISSLVGGHEDMARLLLDKGANVNDQTNDKYTALMAASAQGYLDLVKRLLDEGADVNAQEEKSSYRGAYNILTKVGGRTALIQAAKHGHVDVVKLLLEKGADPSVEDHNNRTALKEALVENDVEVVKALLDGGTDVNQRTGDRGWMPLFWASNLETAKILLEKGADVNAATTDGYTVLAHACSYTEYTEVAKLLIERGADVNAGGGAALMSVASATYDMEDILELTRLLIEYGADVNYETEYGQTALKKARYHGYKKVIRLLKKAGAKK